MDPHVRDEEKEELIQGVIHGEENLDVSMFLNNSGEGDPLFARETTCLRLKVMPSAREKAMP